MRNRKVLGLVLIATLVAGLVGGAVALADELKTESSPVLLSGVNEGNALTSTISLGEIICTEATYAGTVSTPTTSAAVTPTFPANDKSGFFNCSIAGGKATMDTNGCGYQLSVNSGASTTGTAKIECPAGKELTLTWTPLGPTLRCTVHIPPQTLFNAATYSNVGAGSTREITASINVESTLKYAQTAGEGAGKCKTESRENGTFAAKIVLTASQDGGGSAHVGLFLSEA